MKRLCVILLFIIMLLPIFFGARTGYKTIEELQKKISELQQEENTLAKQISLPRFTDFFDVASHKYNPFSSYQTYGRNR